MKPAWTKPRMLPVVANSAFTSALWFGFSVALRRPLHLALLHVNCESMKACGVPAFPFGAMFAAFGKN